MDSTNDDVKERLASAWQGGRIEEVCGILIDEVQSRCIGSLLFKYGGKLSYEDCEDCFNYGVEKLLTHKDNPGDIRNPYSYVWTCAVHECVDMINERNKFVNFDPEWLESEESAMVVAEVALDTELQDAEHVETIKEILSLAISQLSPQRRRLIRVLMEKDVLISNELLAELMSMSNTAVRSLKSHAFQDLRKLFPAAAEELGVDISRLILPEPEVLTPEPPDLPSTDDDAGPMPPVT
jgi:RNA polymerase sigma factor (sigma-70 family)